MGDDLIRALQLQAGACKALGSGFSAALLERAAAEAASSGPTQALFAPWDQISTRDLMFHAVPLRWLGALHDIVLSGDAPGLAAAYPGADRPGDADQAWPEVLAVTTAQPARIAAFMEHEPQTNEVRRSACLLPGFLVAAEATGLPLRVLELGASAGLNQLWDRWRYRLGEVGDWGAAHAPVVLETEWRGPPPPLAAPVSVIARGACDRKPVDLTDPVARRRLEAYIWPDQAERLERLKAAIAAALAAGVRVEAADAVAWTARTAAPRAGAATVVFHSVFFQYMPAQSQAALIAALDAHGAAATPDAPLAWLRMEPPPNNLAAMELRLTMWPGGQERHLANVHPHGAWVEWLGG